MSVEGAGNLVHRAQRDRVMRHVMDESSSEQRSILVVEDDRYIREALSMILQDEGYEVESAPDGQEALEVLRTHRPFSLILLDLMLPVMNGTRFREVQREDPRQGQVPVIVMSADRGGETSAAALEAAAFLPKPIAIDALLDAIHQAV